MDDVVPIQTRSKRHQLTSRMATFTTRATFLVLIVACALISSIDCNKKLSRNYASYECGAKVIASNSEAEGISRILSESKDEYMLNPCKAKIWFIVELCEPIQPSSIELANFELFSSTPKELTIHGSERYPTNKWINLGSFAASDSRDLQRFEIKSQTEFIKFIKIEMLSHYGSEHFCPISLIRAYGVSLVEEFDAIESGRPVDAVGEEVTHVYQDDSSDSLDNSGLMEESIGKDQSTQNILRTAGNAVISMVREVFTKDGPRPNRGNSTTQELSKENLAAQLKIQNVAAKIITQLEDFINKSNCVSKDLQSKGHFENQTSDMTTSLVNFKSVFDKRCQYLETMIGPQVYHCLLTELARPFHIRFKSDPSLAPPKLIQPVVVAPEPVKPEAIGGITIQPIVDTIYSFVTPSYDSLPTLNSSPEVSIPNSSSDANVEKIETSKPVEELSVTSATPLMPPVTVIPPPPVPEPIVKEAHILPPSNDMSTEAEGSLDASTTTAPEVSSEPSAPPPSYPSPSPAATPSSTPTPAITPATNGASSGAVLAASSSKESIFIKLNNRIKALEQNMSVNSGTIEELLTRHREQMLEIQRAFNQTHETFENIFNRSHATDEEMRAKIEKLEAQLSETQENVYLLITEKESFHWQLVQVHLILMILEIGLVVLIVTISIRRITRIAMTATAVREANKLSEPLPLPFHDAEEGEEEEPEAPKTASNRSSVDSSSGEVEQKRKSSDDSSSRSVSGKRPLSEVIMNGIIGDKPCKVTSTPGVIVFDFDRDTMSPAKTLKLEGQDCPTIKPIENSLPPIGKSKNKKKKKKSKKVARESDPEQVQKKDSANENLENKQQNAQAATSTKTCERASLEALVSNNELISKSPKSGKSSPSGKSKKSDHLHQRNGSCHSNSSWSTSSGISSISSSVQSQAKNTNDESSRSSPLAKEKKEVEKSSSLEESTKSKESESNKNLDQNAHSSSSSNRSSKSTSPSSSSSLNSIKKLLGMSPVKK